MHRDLEAALSLEGRVAVVTGAGSGIGRETALVLGKAGAALVLADRDASRLAEASKAAEEAGCASLAVPTDVTRREAVEQLVDAALERHGQLDVMVNAAGILVNARVLELSEEGLDEILAVNLKGVFFGCAAAARAMCERGRGSIVNLASAAIDTPAPGIAAYAMSKAAVAQLTRSLASEVGPDGVRVNSVAPGFVDTHMTRRHFTAADGAVDERARDELWAQMASRTPLGTIGQPSDIAYAILYLASDAARFVTGQVLRPNGGVAMA